MAGRGKRKIDADQESEQSLIDLVPKKPLEVINVCVDHKGNFYGLGNNGLLYKYHIENREWVMM